jgi:hypothetical protein
VTKFFQQASGAARRRILVVPRRHRAGDAAADATHDASRWWAGGGLASVADMPMLLFLAGWPAGQQIAIHDPTIFDVPDRGAGAVHHPSVVEIAEGLALALDGH